MRHSSITYSEVRRVAAFRIDADYWDPDYIANSKLVSSEKSLKEVVSPNIANIKTSPINRDFEYLEISQISLTSFEYQTVMVAQGEEPDRARHILEKGDVVVSTVRPNRNAVALIETDGVIGSSGLSVLRPGFSVMQQRKIESEYLFAFCKTRYFINCLMRANKASMYPAVSNVDVLNIPFFDASELFMSQIAQTVRNSISHLSDAKTQRAEAETLLLSEIGLADWHPKQKLAFRQNYSDVQRAERIDADYFQPKYSDIVGAVEEYPGGWDTLGNLVALKKSVEVGSRSYLEEGVPFVRVSNLSPFEITEEKYISTELYAELRQHQPQQGEILLSKDATPGIAHYLREQPRKMIPAGGILRLQIKTDRVGGEYLTLALNSPLTQQQVERDVGGSVILHWRPEQVAAILIPILPKDKQREIEQKVAESFRLRERSKELLEYAKRAVEIAIEQDEQTAIDWLRQRRRETSKHPHPALRHLRYPFMWK